MTPQYIITHAPNLNPSDSESVDLVPRPPKIYHAAPQIFGPSLWARLHFRALDIKSDDNEWLRRFELTIPCGACRSHWKRMLAATPPDWAFYFHWTVDRHNEINAKLGKPQMDFDSALAKWSQNELVNHRG